MLLKFFKGFCGLIETASTGLIETVEANHFKCLEFLGEIEAICETALARESGP
jgi:hypothetical protein